MTGWVSAALSVLALVVVLAAVHVPLVTTWRGCMTRASTRGSNARPIESSASTPDADQRWPVYLRSVLIFSVFSVVSLYALLRLQPFLPLANGKRCDARIPVAQHCNLVSDEHELAVLLGRLWGFSSRWSDLPCRTFGLVAAGMVCSRPP